MADILVPVKKDFRELIKLPVLNNCFLCGDWKRDVLKSGIGTILGPEALKEAFLWETSDLYLTPALGCLTPGYLILAPKQHYVSFAEAPETLLKSASQVWESVRDFGTALGFAPYVLFEHGAATKFWRGAACIEHAHFHLVPAPAHHTLNQAMDTKYPKRRHDSLEGIKSLDGGPPYIFLINSEGVHSYVTPEIESQYLRKQIAVQWGMADQWNWRTYPFGNHFWETINLFSNFVFCPSRK
jgi:Diadenosine tetraphosphate (Ap4A) hydrolase and other HIT family hydrolases